MKIKIEKSGKFYIADFTELPGSPMTGEGKTPEMALACLFYRYGEQIPERLKGKPIEINGVLWEGYPGGR